MSNTFVYLVIDESDSMAQIRTETDRVVAGWVRGVLGAPDMRVSVLYFGYKPRWVLRHVQGTPAVPGIRPNGMTALRDAMMEALQDGQLQLNADPDASILVLGVTDGGENASRVTSHQLRKQIELARRDGRADVALLVPPGNRKQAASAVGMDELDIREWEISREGLQRADDLVKSSLQSYQATRATGARSVGRFFVDPDKASQAALTSAASAGQLRDVRSRVRKFDVHAKARIDEFGTSRTGSYVVGEWFYQLTKRETIQPQKALLIHDKRTGSWYEGPAARSFLGLSTTQDVKVEGNATGDREVFVQSTSTNRNLIPGTAVVQLRP